MPTGYLHTNKETSCLEMWSTQKRERSVTYLGVALAMANSWGHLT